MNDIEIKQNMVGWVGGLKATVLRSIQILIAGYNKT